MMTALECRALSMNHTAPEVTMETQTTIRRAFNVWRENFSARLDENAPPPKSWREILSDFPELDGRQNSTLGRKLETGNRPKDAAVEYATSPALQAEFGDLYTYLAFRRAEQRGLVKIFKKSA